MCVCVLITFVQEVNGVCEGTYHNGLLCNLHMHLGSETHFKPRKEADLSPFEALGPTNQVFFPLVFCFDRPSDRLL